MKVVGVGAIYSIKEPSEKLVQKWVPNPFLLDDPVESWSDEDRGMALMDTRQYRAALPFLQSAASRSLDRPSGPRDQFHLRGTLCCCYRKLIKVEGPSDELIFGADRWVAYASRKEFEMQKIDLFCWKTASTDLDGYHPLFQLFSLCKNVNRDVLMSLVGLLPEMFREDPERAASCAMKLLLHPLRRKDWDFIRKELLPSLKDALNSKQKMYRKDERSLRKVLAMLEWRIAARRLFFDAFQT